VVGCTGGKRSLQLFRVAHRSRGNPQAARTSESLDGGGASNTPREARIGQVSHPRSPWHQLAQQLETLAVELAAKDHDPGDVAARPSQRRDKALLD
jgi:hypothetical protein